MPGGDPERFRQFGIAEQNMMAAAGGLAAVGLLPVVTDQFATVTVVPNDEIRRQGGATLGDLKFKPEHILDLVELVESRKISSSIAQQVFAEMKVSRYIRGAAAMLLAATAFFSYMVVHQNKDHLTTRFVVELEQNTNFVVVVLTYLLWGAILKLREWGEVPRALGIRRLEEVQAGQDVSNDEVLVELPDLGVVHGGGPGDGSAPVVTD